MRAAPYTIFTQEAPDHYRSTWIAIIAAMCATIVLAFVMRFYLVALNRRKDREQESAARELAQSARTSVASLESSKEGGGYGGETGLQVYARDLSDQKVRPASAPLP